MALFCYFQPANSLATARKTQLRDVVTKSANVAVLCEVQYRLQANQLRKRIRLTRCLPLKRAAIGRYSSENGNVAAVSQ